MKNTQLTTDQTGTLLDLVNDQITIQRVHLRTSEPLAVSYMRSLTHLRNVKRLLTIQELEARIQEEAGAELMEENSELFQMFNV